MKSCFNVLRGMIAFFFTFLYWIFLSISFVILPLSFIVKNGETLNSTLDSLRIEEQIIGLISTSMELQSETATETKTEIPEFDYAKLFEDEEIQTSLISTRREIITEAYDAIEKNIAFNYELDEDLVTSIYEGIFIQYFEELDVCDTWQSADAFEESGDMGCLPAAFAIANDLEIPDSVEIPDDFEITDDLLFENLLGEEGSSESSAMDPIAVSMDADTISALNLSLRFISNYMLIFIVVSLLSLLTIILIAPGFKVIMILMGILNIICSIVAAILWKLPTFTLNQASSYTIEGTTGEEYSTEFMNLLKAVIDGISNKALIMALWVGIIGLLLIVVGIILPKKKKDESEKSSGEDNSTE